MACAPSATEATLSLGHTSAKQTSLSGISFDAEHTLLVYNNVAGGDAANYEEAVLAFNAANAPSDQFLPAPSWQGCPKRRLQAFHDAWTIAENEFISVLCTPDNEHLWNLKVIVPWGGSDVSIADNFFARVCNIFFETACPASFVRFLVHDFYVSTRVYHLPSSIEWLKKLRDDYPNLPIVVVSNTDERVVKATRMFPEYASVFPENMFFHATNLPRVKPSPLAITTAAESCGVAVSEAIMHWLHVGDDLRADGGAASECGCMFLHCNERTGVDFEAVYKIVEGHKVDAFTQTPM
jgi:hypothetical protein